MFGELPEDSDLLYAEEKKIIISSCPICHDEIKLTKKNKFKFTCQCGYEWQTGMFSCSAVVKIDELIKLRQGVWKNYVSESGKVRIDERRN